MRVFPSFASSGLFARASATDRHDPASDRNRSFRASARRGRAARVAAGLDLRPGRDRRDVRVGLGAWTDYHIAFTWIEDVEALHVACAFDLKVPERRRPGGPAAHLARQRAALGRPFRPVERGERGDVPPCAHPGRRRRADPRAQCETMLRGGRRLRALLPGLPVRDLGRQVRPARRSTASCSRPKAKPDRLRGLATAVPTLGPRSACIALVRGRSPCLVPAPRHVPRPRRRRQDGRRHAGGLARGRHEPAAVAVLDPQPSAEIEALPAAGIPLNPAQGLVPPRCWSSPSSRRRSRRRLP